MEFLSRTQIITAFGALALALLVLDLVRRRRLSEEYSLLWVGATLVIAVLGFSTPVLRFITRALGMMFESSTVFAALSSRASRIPIFAPKGSATESCCPAAPQA